MRQAKAFFPKRGQGDPSQGQGGKAESHQGGRVDFKLGDNHHKGSSHSNCQAQPLRPAYRFCAPSRRQQTYQQGLQREDQRSRTCGDTIYKSEVGHTEIYGLHQKSD